MFTNITGGLKTILDGLISTTTLASVYNYDIKTYDSFPSATITPIDGEETFLDTATNEDNLIFKIKVVDQNRSVEKMEARMRTLADAILTALRNKDNCTLSGVIEKMDFSITWGWLDDEQPMRVFEILVKTKSVNSI